MSHRERRIDHYRRLDDGQWHLGTHQQDDALVAIEALAGSIALSEVYRNVDLDEGRPGA